MNGEREGRRGGGVLRVFLVPVLAPPRLAALDRVVVGFRDAVPPRDPVPPRGGAGLRMVEVVVARLAADLGVFRFPGAGR